MPHSENTADAKIHDIVKEILPNFQSKPEAMILIKVCQILLNQVKDN